MSNFIIFFMFVFPGALSEVIVDIVAKNIDYDEGNNYNKIVRYIFFSVITSLICIQIRAWLEKAPVDFMYVVNGLMHGKWLLSYFISTFVVSIMLTALYLWIHGSIRNKINLLRNNVGLASLTDNNSVFDAIMNHQNEFPVEKCVVFVYKDGIEVARGILKYFPLNGKSANTFALIHCDYIDTVLKMDSESTTGHKYIGEDVITYIDMEHNYRIVFREAFELIDHINSTAVPYITE